MSTIAIIAWSFTAVFFVLCVLCAFCAMTTTERDGPAWRNSAIIFGASALALAAAVLKFL